MNLRLRCGEAPVVGFGARLQAAERLIRLGARATVVADALEVSGTARALIRRMYVGIRGPGRPRGPLPFDHVELLGTVAARMDASVFLDAWQRLRDAGSQRGAALA
ncbi:MAG: FlhC family transcriptional regulator, partial [bacterium]